MMIHRSVLRRRIDSTSLGCCSGQLQQDHRSEDQINPYLVLDMLSNEAHHDRH
jgi:hypothetical protein